MICGESKVWFACNVLGGIFKMRVFFIAPFILLASCTTTKQSNIDSTAIRCATIAQDVEPLNIDKSESIDTQCVRVREHAEGVLVRYNQLLKCVRSEK